MSDIVEPTIDWLATVQMQSETLKKQADEIQRLREALREIESNWEVPMEEKGWRALARFMWEKARAALGEKALKEQSNDR